MEMRALVPEGLLRLIDYRRRFQALNLSPNFAFSRQHRAALEHSLIELLPREELSALRCVVDVGANKGSWAIGIAGLTNAERVIAYEPIPEVYSALQRNARKFPHISCFNCAVGATIGRATLHVESQSELSSIREMTNVAETVHGVDLARTRDITVPLTTLDHDLADCDEISLLKIDVQGYEAEVLAGARSILRRTRVLLVEILYSSYYVDALDFTALHSLIVSNANFKLWGISAPAISQDGKPWWADAVYVQTL